jgi:hypothetical protein
MYACTDQAVSSQGCPPSKKKPETHKQAGKQNQPQLTETRAQRNTQREDTNQHAKAEGQRDRVASCNGNKPHQNQQHPIRTQKRQQGTLVNPGTNANNSAATLHYSWASQLGWQPKRTIILAGRGPDYTHEMRLVITYFQWTAILSWLQLCSPKSMPVHDRQP